MMFAVGNFLKLCSFHHVMYDNRDLMYRLKKASAKEKLDANFFNIKDETFKIAIEYPKNLRISHFIRYMCIPSFCYQHVFPSKDSISILYLTKRFFEGILLLMFVSYLLS